MYRRVFNLSLLRTFLGRVVCTNSVLNPYASCSAMKCIMIKDQVDYNIFILYYLMAIRKMILACVGGN